jgi:hypothetical protein
MKCSLACGRSHSTPPTPHPNPHPRAQAHAQAQARKPGLDLIDNPPVLNPKQRTNSNLLHSMKKIFTGHLGSRRGVWPIRQDLASALATCQPCQPCQPRTTGCQPRRIYHRRPSKVFPSAEHTPVRRVVHRTGRERAAGWVCLMGCTRHSSPSRVGSRLARWTAPEIWRFGLVSHVLDGHACLVLSCLVVRSSLCACCPKCASRNVQTINAAATRTGAHESFVNPRAEECAMRTKDNANKR